MGKFTYNKEVGLGNVCYYSYQQVRTNPLVVSWHPHCDYPDNNPGYYSRDFTLGTSWHTLEQHYVAGQLYDVHFDGQEIVTFPAGAGGGKMPNVLMTDFEPGLYTNDPVATSYQILLNDAQICTGTWCSAGAAASKNPPGK
jgi:hypothetical protein